MRRLLGALLALSFGLVGGSARGAHAVAQFGDPRYGPGFDHFDYVNPEAPRGGTLNLSIVSQNSSFDKLNPFSLKGKPAPGLVELMFETLTVLGLDEPNTQYGLIADDIRVAPDFASVEFHVDSRARFSNGDRITAADVLYSYEVLTSKQASPRFKAYFAEVKRVVQVDAATVRFEFKRKGRDLSFIAGSLPVFSSRWGAPEGQAPTPFDQLRMEAPVASGPYVIESASSGQDVTYRRNPRYWGDVLPVRRGAFNFERVVYKLYKDADTQVAALRAGEFDFFSETRMRYWCCQFIGKRFDSGELKKQIFEHRNPPAMNGYVVNLRKKRFQDPRVREALNFALDFEWVNQKIFDNEFERVTSYFSNTPLAATGVPSDVELALLEPYRGQIPDAAFGPMYAQPSTRPPSSLRTNLTRALELLAASGWHDDNGVLKNTDGEPFVIEVAGARNQNPYLDPYYLNLSRLGITVRKRLTDAPSARQRMNKFDFDFTSISLREGRMPGAELWRTFNSKDADAAGSENVAGVKSRAVDELIQKLLDASSQAELETIAHALDRVLVHSHYVVPWRYLTQHYVIFNEKLRRPDQLPPYSGAYDWAVGAWWDGSSAPKVASVTAPSATKPPRVWGWYAGVAAALGLVVLLAGRTRRSDALSRS
jgi:peptide/nickel transport system substrate-binding protein/microcin C transport system substrate-binding protein